MTRILADLPDEDIHWLDARAAELGKSRASMLREAVSAYRAETARDWIARGAGYWQHRDDIADGLAYQRKMRADRPLD